MKFSVAQPNPGKRSAENFTKISRQISRHLWQRKTEKNFTSALLQGSCSDFCSLLKGGHFDENGKHDQFAFTHQNKGFPPQTPPPPPKKKTIKMTKVAGGYQAEAWFFKGVGFSSLSSGPSFSLSMLCQKRMFSFSEDILETL